MSVAQILIKCALGNWKQVCFYNSRTEDWNFPQIAWDNMLGVFISGEV